MDGGGGEGKTKGATIEEQTWRGDGEGMRGNRRRTKMIKEVEVGTGAPEAGKGGMIMRYKAYCLERTDLANVRSSCLTCIGPGYASASIIPCFFRRGDRSARTTVQ